MQEQTEQIDCLFGLGVPADSVYIPLAGGTFLESHGGPKLSSYWMDVDPTPSNRSRDEFFLLATTALYMNHLVDSYPHRTEERLVFDTAYLIQSKLLAQACYSVDLLCGGRCYFDALIALRALHSRVNLLLLFSLGSHLFEEWLQNPKDEKFLDGHIRTELKNHGITLYPQLYEQYSEIMHGQFGILEEMGLLEKGLFPDIPQIRDLVYSAGKFLFGATAWAAYVMILEDYGEHLGLGDEEKIKAVDTLFNFFKNTILISGRLENLPVFLTESRHWEKAGKNKYLVAELFDFDEYKRQVSLFYRKAQPKTLGKKYRQIT